MTVEKFALTAKPDENAKIVVNTPCDVFDEFNSDKTFLQDSVYGSINWLVQMDTPGRDCLQNADGTYKYNVPAPAIVDVVLGISKG